MKMAGAAVLAMLLSACASKPSIANRVLFDHLSDRLKYQYHECVPLGWAPVKAGGTYYPGYTATLATYVEFLDAIWRGRVENGDLHKPDALAVYNVLNHLVEADMLVRTSRAAGFDYYLTWNSIPYFYASNSYNDNHGSLPYFCYSTIVPERILWVGPTLPTRNERIRRGHLFRVSFSWKPSAPASWADDGFLRSHSVILAPTHNPITAKLFYFDGQWWLLSMYDGTWMFPKLVDAAAWPIARSARH